MLFRETCKTDSLYPMVISSQLSRTVGMLFLWALPTMLSANMILDLDHFMETDGFVDPVDRNEVMGYIQHYLNSPQHTEKILSRTFTYLPLVERELARLDLPEELKVLPLIESGYEPGVGSSKGALGMWQFMSITGREMGLVMNAHIDERKDPEKSTRAALCYLKYLHQKYGDWSLAFAAYNAGPTRVNRAIRLSGGNRSFQAIKRFLPRETQAYIPKYIAAQYIIERFDDHGLNPDLPDLDLQWTTTIPVERELTLQEISEAMDISLEKLQRLNPSLIKDRIPGMNRPYSLVLPQRIHLSFENYLANLGHDTRGFSYTLLEYNVDENTSIFELADKFDVDPYLIKSWNQIAVTEIKRGDVLRIYQVCDPCDHDDYRKDIIIPNPFKQLPAKLSAKEIIQLVVVEYNIRQEEQLNWELHRN